MRSVAAALQVGVPLWAFGCDKTLSRAASQGQGLQARRAAFNAYSFAYRPAPKLWLSARYSLALARTRGAACQSQARLSRYAKSWSFAIKTRSEAAAHI